MTCRVALFALLAACGGVATNPNGQPDAPPDMPSPDMPPDMPAPLPAHHYIMDKQVVPLFQQQAKDLGLDIDGDNQPDNQLGAVAATLAGQGFDIDGTAKGTVDRGATLMLVELGSDGFTAGRATFTLFTGANPQPPACNGGGDTVCRRHLDGNGAFDVAATSAHDTPLAGTLAGGELLTERDDAARLHLQVSLGTADPVTLTLLGARAKISGASDAKVTNGIVGGGVPKTDIDTFLLPAWQKTVDARVKQACTGTPPTCGCPANSQEKTLHDLFDTAPNDCTISLFEIQNNSLVQSLLAPDLTIEGQQSVSLGIGFTAIRGAFTP